DAALGQQASDLIDQSGPLLNETAAHAVDRLDILALHGLERHEAHVGPGHCLTDCLGVAAIILIAFDIGLDELRADEFHGVAQLLKLPRPILRTRARFHPNHTRWQLRYRLEQLTAGHALLNDDFAVLVYPMQLENTFGQINPECRDFHDELSLS